MKEIKCPTCKGKLDQINVLRDGTLVEVGCHKCKWSTHPNSPEEAWKEAEEFISLFPPIMRAEVGDKVIRNAGWLFQDDVVLWPWELEQKGGQQ